MSGSQIAAEVAAALREVARDVGDGAFIVTLLRGPDEPETPWDAGNYGEPQDYELPALVQNYGGKGFDGQAIIDGTLIQADDKRVLLPATGPQPTTSDRLLIGGVSYAIVSIRETAPSGVAIYYECQARK